MIELNFKEYTLFCAVFGANRTETTKAPFKITHQEAFKAAIGWNDQTNLFGNNTWYKQLAAGIFTVLTLPFTTGKLFEFGFKYSGYHIEKTASDLSNWIKDNKCLAISTGFPVVALAALKGLELIAKSIGFILGACFSQKTQYRNWQRKNDIGDEFRASSFRSHTVLSTLSCTISLLFNVALAATTLLAVNPFGIAFFTKGLLAKVALGKVAASVPTIASYAVPAVSVPSVAGALFSKPRGIVPVTFPYTPRGSAITEPNSPENSEDGDPTYCNQN